MEKYIFDATNERLIRKEESEPECGKDFCAACGDCLHCYGGDPCNENQEDGEHYWTTQGKEELINGH